MEKTQVIGCFMKLASGFFLMASCFVHQAWSSNEYIQEMAAATNIDKSIVENTLRPVPSVTWSNMDARKAYNVQKRVVAERLNSGEVLAGFKAGLTSKDSAKKFALHEPVTGVLFQSSLIKDFKDVRLKGAHRLMMEQEVAFLLAQDISKKVEDIASLKGHFSHISYALEFPDLGFSSQPKGVDIIANNLVNRYYYVGPWQQMPENINQYNFSISCKGEQVNSGISSDAMGDQWRALLWMVNQLQQQGYALNKGQIFITGNIGQLIPAALCDYSANFDALGTVRFSVTP